ncbi:MAG: DUF1292 domain-containing protein [Clostridia bacterium]|nr:DUF1292 domain-containing protein [Clostridia bacterium]
MFDDLFGDLDDVDADDADSLNDLSENIIMLNDESGNEVPFEFLDLINYKDEEYVILLPVGDEAGEVVILKIDTDNFDEESESYVSVDDDKTLMAVFEIFKEKFKDDFDFVD